MNDERLLKSPWQPTKAVSRVLFIKPLTDISVEGAADLCRDESWLQPPTALLLLELNNLTNAPETVPGLIVHMTHRATECFFFLD